MRKMSEKGEKPDEDDESHAGVLKYTPPKERYCLW